jgi:hypothetical protein
MLPYQRHALCDLRLTFLKKKQGNNDESESSSEEDDEEDSEEDSDDDDDDPASEMIRASRREAVERAKAEQKAKKRAEKAASKKLAKERKKKDVNLNKLTSISGSKSCYTCGGDHLMAQCPQRSKRGYPGGENDGPRRKAIKTR